MTQLAELLAESTALHRHLCPRQVLGVRMGMYAAHLLDLNLPQTNKRLLTLVETDGCFADGVSVATGCHMGRRTMRLIDYGKVAATFIDTRTKRAVRIAPHRQSRQRACDLQPLAKSRWHAQLDAYQALPFEQLLTATFVDLTLDIDAIISRPGLRVNCEQCGEEIINQREVILGDRTLCRSCADGAYYIPATTSQGDDHT